VLARGDGADAARDAAVLRDYFNLDTGLAALSDEWAARDSRFAGIRDYIPGRDLK
jgi:intraflagellar transport protein 122